MDDMRRNLLDLTTTLRQSEAEAQAVLQGVVEGVYAVDADRRIRYLNPQAAKMLGAPAGGADRPVLRRRAEAARRRRPAALRLRLPDLHARATTARRSPPSTSTAGGVPRTVVITSAAPAGGLQVQVMRDETELEAVRRARDSVLANISHEFRTPLSAQLASIELMLDGLDAHAARAARRAAPVAAARHAAADAPDRQPARERAHRVGPARHPPPAASRSRRWSRMPRT